VKTYLNESTENGFSFPVTAQTLAELIGIVEAGKVSFAAASQKILPELLKQPRLTPLELAQQLNLLQDSNEDSILPIVEQVIKEFPLKVEEYKKGKKAIVTMFMGEVMKRSKGKADPKLATELLLKKLS
jgi:aspartyl-tRNA(Asn)/glutamyl-tRNA(Gln) amidotransferase subunit B